MIRTVPSDKLSATVDRELLAAVRSRVGPRGLSAFVDQAMRHELARAEFSDFLDEIHAKVGEPDPAAVAAEAASIVAELAETGRRNPRRARTS